MSPTDIKIALIIDPELPVGLIANTAAVLALTLGHRIDGLIGPDIPDGSGQIHVGITTLPLPILIADPDAIRTLRARAVESGLLVVDFCDAAQTTTAYNAYTDALREAPAADLRYLGIAICGARKPVNKLTGSLPLLR
jgi:hypothetical protein